MLPETPTLFGAPETQRPSERGVVQSPAMSRLCVKGCQLCLYLEAKKGMSAAHPLLRIGSASVASKWSSNRMQPVTATAAVTNFARMG